MPNFFQNRLFCLLLLLIPATVCAKSDKDADAIVTMRNGQPCFSYPKDKQYSFASLDVSEKGPYGGRGGWEIGLLDPYGKKGLLDPNSSETCIKYGVLNPGMKETQPAEALQFNTPYRVRISTMKTSKSFHEWRYALNFCLSRNAKGETILVGADWDDKAGAMKCLKPGESPKRSFWQKLFGR